MGEKGIALKHRVDGPLVGRQSGNILPVKQDLSACRQVESRDHSQRRRLAAARGAEEGDELTFVDVEAHIVDDKVVIIILGDVFEFDDVFSHVLSCNLL